MITQVSEKTAHETVNCILLSGVSWEQFEQIEAALDETGVRLTYLDGVLEIMNPPSLEHEEPKKTVGMLLEIYLREKGMRFYAVGSTWLGKKEKETRREPDESYSLGSKKPVPDLVLEVVVTSGGINKLHIYQRLKVPEVWFWEDGGLSVYCLRDIDYEKSTRSELLPELDLELLAKYSRMADQYDAVNEFTNVIRQK